MIEFFHNLSIQALCKCGDTTAVKFDAMNRLNKSLINLLTAESLAFDTARILRMMTEFFDQPIFVIDQPSFVTGEETDKEKIEENIERSILNDGEMEFPTDTDQMTCQTWLRR